MDSNTTYGFPSPYLEPFSPIKPSHLDESSTITINEIIHNEDAPEIILLDDSAQDIELCDVPEFDYASDRSSTSSPEPPQIVFTEIHLKHLNEQLEQLPPQDILRICKLMFPNLYQTTAFGLTGLVTLDMLSKLHLETPGSSPVDLIFLDTLYHFQETYQLVSRIQEHYPDVSIHTFRPQGCETASEFEARYGSALWETDAERYDYLAKVEPQQRSYEVLGVAAILTGRRRSQGAKRGDIPILEMDRERGVVKINPFVNWSFNQVLEYIKTNNVPYNELLDRGYKSVGDWHSTQPVAAGEDERAGRWKGQDKSECGIHNKKSRYAMFLEEMAKKQADEEQIEMDETESTDQSTTASTISSLPSSNTSVSEELDN
ncbi:Phosphoadenosine phosphosulfate reductase family-domain-containing protein [Xylariaceae sp. FL1019]|nr:Phosphoadenosine phosphosulfate reductase family-domain-containing protein [Xylariaceae sp. FL1019]